jgi:hypothetical protein
MPVKRRTIIFFTPVSNLEWKITQKIQIIKHRSRYRNCTGPEVLYDWNDTIKSDENGGSPYKNLAA